MGHDSRALEERRWPDALGSIDDLVGDDEVSRLDFFSKGSDGAEGDDGLDAERLERSNVGAGRNGGRVDRVVNTVSG